MRIFRHYVSAPAVAMLLVEVLLIGIILFAFVTAGRPVTLPSSDYFADARVAGGLAVAIALIMCSTGAYDKSSLSDYRHLFSRLFVCLVICLLSLLAVAYLDAKNETQILGANEHMLIFALFAVFPAIFITRVMYFAAIRGRAAERRILVVGAGPVADRIERFARSHLDFNADVVGYTPVANEAIAVPQDKVVAMEDSLAAVATRLGATEIVVAITERRGFPTTPLLECRLRGFVVTNFLNFWERETRQVMLDMLDPSWLIYSDGFQLAGALNAALKRTFDVLVSLLILVTTSPILALAAIAVKLDSSGPIFYKQERVGRNGKVFNIFKLRTMQSDAEKGGVPRVGRRAGSAGHPDRRLPAAHADRRNSSDLQRVPGRYELRRSASRTAVFRRDPGARHPVLSGTAAHAPGNYRLGTDQLSVWRFDRGRQSETVLRPLLHQELQHFL